MTNSDRIRAMTDDELAENTSDCASERSNKRKVVKTEGRMHTGDWSAVSVRCPFWRGETSQAICCEGPSRGELVRRIFPNKAMKKDLKKRLCCGDYETCVVYKMVWATYDETSGL